MYGGEFTCWDDVKAAFQIDEPEGGKIVLLAEHDRGDYDGSATVLYLEDGRFHLVEGSHCSCYGLEGQWTPEEMPLDAVLRMMVDGNGPLHVSREALESSLREWFEIVGAR